MSHNNNDHSAAAAAPRRGSIQHGPSLYQTDWITELPLLHQGKVRDIFAVGDDKLLIVASDRLSAFDVVLPDPIPHKGEWLTLISNFWFARTASLQANHLVDLPLAEVLDDADLARQLAARSVIVQKLEGLPVEAIVRGYLAGSGWKDYQANGSICGIELPAGLSQAERLPETLFTPSTKAQVGDHDENISMEALVEALGGDMARQVMQASLCIYRYAADYARRCGIIIADTKFEFGTDAAGNLLLMDEVLTPDSSRFWPEEAYATGISPPSYDKQFVRDYLETLDWNKTAPGPKLPDNVIERTGGKYLEACQRLMGED